MKHVCMIELGDYSRLDDPLFTGPNYAIGVPWDYREGTERAMDYDNDANITRLAKMPPGMRFVLGVWGGDERLPDKQNMYQSKRLAAAVNKMFPREKKPLDLLYYDNEGERASYPNINRVIAPAVAKAKATCGFDDCLHGSSCWNARPFAGKTIGTHGCASSYRAVTNQRSAMLLNTIRVNAPKYVQHLPPCKADDLESDDYTSENVYARTRQVIFYAASHGVTRFILAEYMLSRESLPARLAHISQCLRECDEVYP